MADSYVKTVKCRSHGEKNHKRLTLTDVLTKLFLPFRSLSMNKLTQLNDHLLRDTNNLEYM